MANYVMDDGPAIDQSPIPILGEPVNDIGVTVTDRPGAVLIIAKVIFTGAAAGEIVGIEIYQNAAPLSKPATASATATAVADILTCVANAAVDAAIGDEFTIIALASAGTPTIPAGLAALTVIGLPAVQSLTPQFTAT